MARAFPSFVDRYFTRAYAVDFMKKPLEDHCILFHSNSICVLTLAQSHPAIQQQEGARIKSVDFRISEKVHRGENKVSGKSKRGAQFLVPDAPICRILLENDTVYTIRACIFAKLIEINERLIGEPSLLATHPETSGYICVMMQKKHRGETSADQILSLTSRCAYLELRFPNTASQEDQKDHNALLIKNQYDDGVDGEQNEED